MQDKEYLKVSFSEGINKAELAASRALALQQMEAESKKKKDRAQPNVFEKY